MTTLLLLVLTLVHASHSQKLVETLPGFPGRLPFKLETGYIGVGEGEDLQMFYYFVESERNPEDDPIMIKLAGGPGCSSFIDFFTGTGPFAIDSAKSIDDSESMECNPYRWTQVANMLFFDVSVSGFSYAKNPESYKNSDTLTAKYIYEFLRKWLNSHPKFQNHSIYVACISYAGIIAPILIQNIYNGNDVGGNEPPINIKGYIMGNPLTDRDIDFNSRIPYAHGMALLSDEIYEAATINCNGNFVHHNSENTLCVKHLEEAEKCLEDIYTMNILQPMCTSSKRDFLLNTDGTSGKKMGVYNHPLQYLSQAPEDLCMDKRYEYAVTWANSKAAQTALNIRQGTIEDPWTSCIANDHYAFGKNDTPTYSYNVPSSIAYHKNFTQRSIRALIYSGDHDLTFPYLGTRKWIHSLNLSVDQTWTPWYVNNQVAGYKETFVHGDYSLTFATFKGAGHIPPDTMPEQTLAMIDRWLRGIPL